MGSYLLDQVKDGPVAIFLGFWATLTNALFAYIGTELIGVCYYQSLHSRKWLTPNLIWQVTVGEVTSLFTLRDDLLTVHLGRKPTQKHPYCNQKDLFPYLSLLCRRCIRYWPCRSQHEQRAFRCDKIKNWRSCKPLRCCNYFGMFSLDTSTASSHLSHTRLESKFWITLSMVQSLFSWWVLPIQIYTLVRELCMPSLSKAKHPGSSDESIVWVYHTLPCSFAPRSAV